MKLPKESHYWRRRRLWRPVWDCWSTTETRDCSGLLLPVEAESTRTSTDVCRGFRWLSASEEQRSEWGWSVATLPVEEAQEEPVLDWLVFAARHCCTVVADVSADCWVYASGRAAQVWDCPVAMKRSPVGGGSAMESPLFGSWWAIWPIPDSVDGFNSSRFKEFLSFLKVVLSHL